MNLVGDLIRIEVFSLNILGEILGLQKRKQELHKLLFSHLSNGIISFHLFSHPPPFGCPLPPLLFTPISWPPLGRTACSGPGEASAGVSVAHGGVQTWADPTLHY